VVLNEIRVLVVPAARTPERSKRSKSRPNRFAAPGVRPPTGLPRSEAVALNVFPTGLAASAIRPQYLSAAAAFYAGTMDWEAFAAATPSKLADFIRPEFAASGWTGQTPYWRVLQDNQAYRWKSVTPLRIYYGGRDEVTPAYIGKLPAATQALVGGAAATAVDAGADADHRGVFVFGVIDAKAWFDGLVR